MYRFWLLLGLSTAALARPEVPVNRRLAAAANTLGMQRYHSGELLGAAEQFRVAIDSDKSYVQAHYNLACVASRLGDTTTAVAELGWLADDSDPASRSKLGKAKSDPDLDYVSALPDARDKLGLPTFEKSRPSAWLTERTGVWSAELPDGKCSERSYTLNFHEDGSVGLKVHELCDGKIADGEFHGSLSLTPVSVTINDWKAWPGSVPLTFAPCAQTPQAAGTCFTLAGTRSQLGPFHRGQPLPRDHKQLAGPAQLSR
jgi:hypothetical protein